jgi:hypothetical protein
VARTSGLPSGRSTTGSQFRVQDQEPGGGASPPRGGRWATTPSAADSSARFLYPAASSFWAVATAVLAGDVDTWAGVLASLCGVAGDVAFHRCSHLGTALAAPRWC